MNHGTARVWLGVEDFLISLLPFSIILSKTTHNKKTFLSESDVSNFYSLVPNQCPAITGLNL